MKKVTLSTTFALLVLGLVSSAFARSPLKGAPALAAATSHATAGGTLRLEATLSHNFVPVQGSQKMHARVQLKAGDAPATERAPMNLALVIDRSGSMGGGRLEQAKAAAHLLVDRLNPDDRLGVVSYSDNVTVDLAPVPVTAENAARLHKAIDAIQLGGQTNLEGGFLQGARLLSGRTGVSANAISRVILLSDGHANVGASTPEALGKLAAQQLQKGISLSAMGIGLDYNEKLMAQMASEGAGNYYFVENAQKLAEIFQDEFKSLADIVARDAKVVLTVAPGVEILKVHGVSHTLQGNQAHINLGAFFARQQKDLLVDLAVAGRPDEVRDILNVRLDFTDVTQNDKSVFSRVALSALTTGDASKLAQTNKSVMERVEQIAYADSVARANEAWERGQREEAERILTDQQARLKSSAMAAGISQPKLAEKVAELEAQKKQMRAAPAPAAPAAKRLRKATHRESSRIMLDSTAF